MVTQIYFENMQNICMGVQKGEESENGKPHRNAKIMSKPEKNNPQNNNIQIILGIQYY